MQALGPLMIDLPAAEITSADRKRLMHPAVGGVILFARHFETRAQIAALVDEIRALRRPHLLVAVDQEGGRVQRFVGDGFIKLPSMGRIGTLFTEDQQAGLEAARSIGWLMAAQLRAIHVDISFAPVLDLDRGISGVIGDRAFDARPEAVIALAISYIEGMKQAGMAAVGKHYPGHGAVAADSHIAHPVDKRTLAEIEQSDLRPFRALAERYIPGLMVSHVTYPQLDSLPAGFSPVWIKQMLREQWGYQGAVLTDDLSMEGAALLGDTPARVEKALAAGVDMALICNHPEAVDAVLAQFAPETNPQREARLGHLFGHGPHFAFESLPYKPEYKQALRWIERLGEQPPDLFPGMD